VPHFQHTVYIIDTAEVRTLGHLLLNVKKSVKEASRYLGPVIEERQRQYDQYGIDYPNKSVSLVRYHHV
jgi:hypothetical protein